MRAPEDERGTGRSRRIVSGALTTLAAIVASLSMTAPPTRSAMPAAPGFAALGEPGFVVPVRERRPAVLPAPPAAEEKALPGR
ncbi:MAG: hypothetical protein ACOC9N_00295 [Gemmatimonadota bacterium]